MKRIIITGASRGIGLAVVKLLLQEGDCEVIGTSVSGNHSIEAPNFTCYSLDLEVDAAVDEFAEKIKLLEFDYLINNAGVLLEQGNNSAIDFQQLEQTFSVNLFGIIRLTEHLLSEIQEGGHIIQVTSNWGSFSDADFDACQPHYKMSKAALNMYTKLLAKRLEPKGIIVSSFDPGWVKTDMGGPEANRTAETVAKELIDLMIGKVETGNFWYKGRTRPW
ncbi:SDR family NAD(P)-dependent oxidoreductase [Sunxiuqinia elliptica]|uniref:NAD(P)-dependent dehydrogenase, short-chain alcohol dehydrogenase family n=1 Tax=Sunxiuqinia elliptica TaxID=655355 RepID=A0A1I2G423_9BACT|nr:SDR family NAD(P)-dependent oxidoreductase [Sunxiuqinia elliptica]SFF11381.1 NAD(P)-dependent dehydrogenase, short-chain alcohol dehydrogenase family [Sunxiuqinia elliptica]